jgi:hypothetical protein
MRTDKLIDILSTNLEPVKRGQLEKTLAWAVTLGGAVAFCLMLATVGPRREILNGSEIGFFALKIVWTLSLILIGFLVLTKLIRPVPSGRKLVAIISFSFLPVAIAGAVALVRSADWGAVMLGTQWATCALCIPLFATVPYILLIWALRKGAPTNLKRAGAIAGLVAGALGAMAYAFHCPDDFLPFLAVWYGGLIALCAFIGARLGPRLLRW